MMYIHELVIIVYDSNDETVRGFPFYICHIFGYSGLKYYLKSGRDKKISNELTMIGDDLDIILLP
jgi:hypothetical protein